MINVASDDAYALGEGPLWDARRERVLWVDIDAGLVLQASLDGDRLVDVVARDFAETVGAVAVSVDGDLLVAGARELLVESAAGARRRGPRVIDERRNSRLNDGKCDPAGRFVVGSMSLDGQRGAEILARLDDNGALTVIDDDLFLANGLGWSPDGRTMYSIDTERRVVWSRDYDVASGETGARHPLIAFESAPPDGMCVDQDGNLWIAIWGGGQVRRFSERGEELRRLDVPAPNTTSCAFVGRDLDRLLITTAAKDVTPRERRAFPYSGRLFVADVGARGLPVTPWCGDAPPIHPPSSPSSASENASRMNGDGAAGS